MATTVTLQNQQKDLPPQKLLAYRLPNYQNHSVHLLAGSQCIITTANTAVLQMSQLKLKGIECCRCFCLVLVQELKL